MCPPLCPMVGTGLHSRLCRHVPGAREGASIPVSWDALSFGGVRPLTVLFVVAPLPSTATQQRLTSDVFADWLTGTFLPYSRFSEAKVCFQEFCPLYRSPAVKSQLRMMLTCVSLKINSLFFFF